MTKFAELASVSDAELVRRARDSSSPEERHAAFMEIYGRHLEGVSWVCGRMLRETDSALDAIQDTFTAAYEDLCLKEAEVRELGAWLTGIAKRRCYPYMRGGKVQDRDTGSDRTCFSSMTTTSQRRQAPVTRLGPRTRS